MSKVIIIGAGGVANVVAKKCAQNDSVFTDVLIATRTVSKADKIVAEIKQHMPDSRATFSTATVDADRYLRVMPLIGAAVDGLRVRPTREEDGRG